MKHLCVLCLLFALCGNTTASKADKSMNIVVNGETRQYWLYVPNNAKANCPLVVSLHGASGHSTDRSPFRTDVADREGCIVVYPQGNPIYFPVFGGTVTGWDASGEENGDVNFLKAVIEDVAKRYTIDRNRIYCCGFSNGGMMTYALTNTCSDVFAAFASISGFPLNEFHFRHTGQRPVPFLHIHGKQDDFVRYALMPVIVDEMVARIGANPMPQKTTVSGRYDKSIYEGTEGGFPYIYYEIDGMGHNDFTGNTETGSSAQTMWNFFKQYTLDTPCDTTLKWMPRIETEGYNPKAHGWTVKASSTLLRFGGDQNTDNNQNVYRSLQLTTGTYKLCFHADGEPDWIFSVRLQKLTGKKDVVLKESLNPDGDKVVYFTINDGWGEYQLTFNARSTYSNTTITNLSIYSASEEEATGVHPIQCTMTDGTTIYSLAGTQKNKPNKGIYIKNRRKFLIR